MGKDFPYRTDILEFCSHKYQGMAKTKQKFVAKNLFVELHKTQKEIAASLGITEKTIGKWVQEGNWKAQRNAKLNGTQQRVERIKEVISTLTDDHLGVLAKIKEGGNKKDLDELRRQSSALSQGIAIQTKALERIDKDHKISLSTYLEVMEDIFNHLRDHDRGAYFQTLDFQSQHLQSIAQKLG